MIFYLPLRPHFNVPLTWYTGRVYKCISQLCLPPFFTYRLIIGDRRGIVTAGRDWGVSESFMFLLIRPDLWQIVTGWLDWVAFHSPDSSPLRQVTSPVCCRSRLQLKQKTSRTANCLRCKYFLIDIFHHTYWKCLIFISLLTFLFFYFKLQQVK